MKNKMFAPQDEPQDLPDDFMDSLQVRAIGYLAPAEGVDNGGGIPEEVATPSDDEGGIPDEVGGDGNGAKEDAGAAPAAAEGVSEELKQEEETEIKDVE